MTTNLTQQVLLAFNKQINSEAPKYSIGTPQETGAPVPVGQPVDNSKAQNPIKKNDDLQSELTSKIDNNGDFSSRLTEVAVPDNVTQNNGIFGFWGKKNSDNVQMLTKDELASLQAQVDSGIPLDDKQMAALTTQFDNLLANQSPEAQNIGKSMEYLSSHGNDFLDSNGKFKLPDDFKEQPKEVQDYILKMYGAVSGGQEIEN